MEKIDFVIAWVDGSDKAWLAEKDKYRPGVLADSSNIRFRDWDNLKYWFRGVEQFAPWVNNIYFLTWGHTPSWLNTSHPKLKIINHADYIPEEYLPTFNSHTIELNMNRIEELSENIVYFNDDMYLISPVKERDFFINDIPRDSAVLSVHCNQRSIIESHIPVAITGVINDHFNMKKVIKRDLKKWFYPGYGLFLLLRTICLLPSPRFPGFWQHHLPTSFKKSSFDKVWKEEPDILNETCSNKFRTANDVSQWIVREWQICEGNFIPRRKSFGKSFHIDRKGIGEVHNIQKYIELQKGKIVVINDGEMDEQSFEDAKKRICDSFEKILPNKSSFEK
ncbi:MAG: Stealth CR1 domain-containing protein [Oscillospiraceae bacterium]|nr:Stealth CR1 domain-containing protein [Oscillospiraceae bacterium]